MSTILCIETSTEVCSVAISSNNGTRIVENRLPLGNKHSSGLTTLIKSTLSSVKLTIKDIDAVAVSAGPGSYTGLRVGASTAKGLCHALDIPLLSIGTLEALATRSTREADYILATVDARRMEVYAAIYDEKLNVIRNTFSLIYTEEAILNISSSLDHRPIVICGNGAQKLIASEIQLPDNIKVCPYECSARNMIDLSHYKYDEGDYADTAYFSPHYYKSPKITSPKPLI